MKNLIAFLLAIYAMEACSKKIHVYTTTVTNEQSAASYKTYNWLDFDDIRGGIKPNEANYTNEFFYYYNELNNMYIHEAVDAELKLFNLRFNNNEASFQVRYYIITNHTDSFNIGFSGKDTAMLHTINPNHPAAINVINENELTKGTLVIEITDIKTKQLIWRGWSAGAFEKNPNSSRKEDIDKTVRKIFAGFPLKITVKS